MIKVEDNCVDCGQPCLRESCPNYRRLVCRCDSCGAEVEDLYEYKDIQLCQNCLLETTHITSSNY